MISPVFEGKALNTVNHLTKYMVRALLIIALIIGSCLLCMASAFTGDGSVMTTVFRIMGFAGYALSVFFVWHLYRNMKKNK